MRALLLTLALAGGVTLSADWRHYGGSPEATRYSPLTQITPSNVASLKVAWTYDTNEAFEGSEMQCQPVVADGVLYATSPKLRVFALDAATGAEKWSFNPLEGDPTPSRTRIRGQLLVGEHELAREVTARERDQVLETPVDHALRERVA